MIYESPFRVVKTLEDIKSVNDRALVIAGRELTKAFEEIIRGSVGEVISYLEAKDKIKGEFAIIVVPEVDDDNNQEDSDA